MATLKEYIKKHREIGLLDDPGFNKTRKCHDWRNHVPDEVRSIWKDLCYESRVAVFLVAERKAMNENWD